MTTKEVLSTKTITKTAPRTDISEPGMYRVLYINDDVTTVDFVVESLMSIFGHDPVTAAELTEKVHFNGSAVVAILPYEMAEQKGVEATQLARNNGFPLVIKLEADE